MPPEPFKTSAMAFRRRAAMETRSLMRAGRDAHELAFPPVCCVPRFPGEVEEG
jgi:hypothetical protein